MEAYAILETGGKQTLVKVGDKIEIIHPDGNQVVTLAELQNHEGMPIQVAPGNGIQVRVPNMQGKEKAVLARLLEPQATSEPVGA